MRLNEGLLRRPGNIGPEGPGSLSVTRIQVPNENIVSNVLHRMEHLAKQKTGVHSAGATRMGPSLPLRWITTGCLSAGDLSPCSAALVITFSSRLDRDLHGQKVISRHGFAFIFIRHLCHRPRLRFQFHRKLAGSSSPCFAGLSLDLTNYGNSFSGV